MHWVLALNTGGGIVVAIGAAVMVLTVVLARRSS